MALRRDIQRCRWNAGVAPAEFAHDFQHVAVLDSRFVPDSRQQRGHDWATQRPGVQACLEDNIEADERWRK